MKYAFLLFSCFCLHISQAQNEFFIAGYAGLSTSQVSGDELGGFNKIGAYAGLATGQEFKENWEWEVGIILSQKGSYTASRSNPNFRYLLNLTYIDVPLSFRRFIKVAHLEFGPTFSVLTSFREHNALGPVNDPRTFKRFEVGGFIGAMYDINDRVSAIARFSNSLIPIREHRNNAVYLWNRGQYNSYVSVAIRLGL